MPVNDGRRLEVVVDGLPLYRGAHSPWTPRSCQCCTVMGHHTEARQRGGFQSMYESLISTSFRQGGSITGRLRLWLMVCRSSTERNWQLMQTLVSPIRGDGSARGQCADHDGAVLQQARHKKESTYPELARPRGGRARLVVLGCEIGGRWSDEARDFVSQLAMAKSRSDPPQLRSARHAWFRRWRTLLACSAARSFGLSPLELRGGFGMDGETPSTSAELEEFGQERQDFCGRVCTLLNSC